MPRSPGASLAWRLQRWIPEPFVFAIVLTLITAALALAFTDAGPGEVLDYWYRGFWLLLEFGMQMVLVLTTGFAIALSPAASRLIDRLARLARTPGAVYLLVMIAGALFSLVSWGWVVLTAVLARELARRVDGIDYAFLVACVFLSSQVWVGGLSSTIPLLLNTDGNFLQDTGVLASTVPVTATLGSALNLLYLGLFVLSLPALMWLRRPRGGSVTPMTALAEAGDAQRDSVAAEAAALALDGTSPADRLNNGRPLQLLLALAAGWVVVRHVARSGFDIDLNLVIFAFVALGLLAHGTPMRYAVAMKRACANISGIVFQYPFYAGIMGIAMFSGLGALVADALAAHATLTTLPLLAQFAGALVNFAIPSAGGEWAVIGPALTSAAQELTATLSPQEATGYLARIAMSVAYGETSTNLLQPFFLLTVLPVMGAGVRIQARDVLGHLVVPFVWIYAATALLLVVAP